MHLKLEFIDPRKQFGTDFCFLPLSVAGCDGGFSVGIRLLGLLQQHVVEDPARKKKQLL